MFQQISAYQFDSGNLFEDYANFHQLHVSDRQIRLNGVVIGVQHTIKGKMRLWNSMITYTPVIIWIFKIKVLNKEKIVWIESDYTKPLAFYANWYMTQRSIFVGEIINGKFN